MWYPLRSSHLSLSAVPFILRVGHCHLQCLTTQNNIIISCLAWQKITLLKWLILYGFSFLYIIWQRGLFATLMSWVSWIKRLKNQETKLRWPSASVDVFPPWLPPWTEIDRLYEFSPGGNKVQLRAPSALQIMFIVELSVIKPITAEQIKASTRKLISFPLSPLLNHGSDLMPLTQHHIIDWDGSK